MEDAPLNFAQVREVEEVKAIQELHTFLATNQEEWSMVRKYRPDSLMVSLRRLLLLRVSF